MNRGFTLSNGHSWHYRSRPMPAVRVILQDPQGVGLAGFWEAYGLTTALAGHLLGQLLPAGASANRGMPHIWRLDVRMVKVPRHVAEPRGYTVGTVQQCLVAYRQYDSGNWDYVPQSDGTVQVQRPRVTYSSVALKAPFGAPFCLLAMLVSFYTGEHITPLRERIEAEAVLHGLER